MRPTLANLHLILDGYATNRLPLHPHEVADIKAKLEETPRKDAKAFAAEMVPALWEDRADDVHRLTAAFLRRPRGKDSGVLQRS